MFLTINDPLVNLLPWSGSVNTWSILLRLVLAALIGGAIGYERSHSRHTAGLRTNILVCVGSAVAMIVNLALQESGLTTDAVRLAANVLTGIGFIGAGAIITNSRSQVKGITTAAALWADGCIGVGIGAGCYTLSIAAAILIVLALTLLPSLEKRIKAKSRQTNLHIELLSRPDLEKLIDYIRSLNITINSITYDPAYANTGLSVYTVSVYDGSLNYHKSSEIKEMIEKLDYVHYIEII